MALFRNKKPDNNVDEATAELQRAHALAQQGTAQVESQLGMDIQSVMKGATDAMQGGGMEKMMAYRNRAARIYQRGVEMPATLRSIELGQHSPMLGGIPAQVQLSVEPPGGSSYSVSTDQVMDPSSAHQFAPGQRVTVKVDPDDPQCLMIWGVVQPAAAQPGPATAPSPPAVEDVAARLAKLHELWRTGVLTDEEFEAQKARMLVGEQDRVAGAVAGEPQVALGGDHAERDECR